MDLRVRRKKKEVDTEGGRKGWRERKRENAESGKQDAYIMIIVLSAIHAVSLDLPHCMFK